MDDRTRQALRQQWEANEKALAAARAQRPGTAEAFAEVERLEKTQDEIEFDLGGDYVRNMRDAASEGDRNA